ncbi:MAG: hypothetical protein J6P57_00270 [Lachnospiraceae bacterium]|nr:hypothetical protein [Lachnospiraceae bacterium]
MDKKYAIQGIIGCVLFGIGDWLLGFVNPDKVEGDTFYFISAGHGAGYADWKILVTMVCAVIGVLFMYQGCVHIADYMIDEKDKVGAARVFAFFTYMWLVLHFIVTVNVFAYSYMCKNFGTEEAALMSKSMDKVFSPALYIAYFFIAIALVDFIIVIARGRTTLKKREAFFTPLTWILIIGLISMIIPNSAFSKGLYTFCMNGGMIVWFVREMCRGKI